MASTYQDWIRAWAQARGSYDSLFPLFNKTRSVVFTKENYDYLSQYYQKAFHAYLGINLEENSEAVLNLICVPLKIDGTEVIPPDVLLLPFRDINEDITITETIITTTVAKAILKTDMTLSQSSMQLSGMVMAEPTAIAPATAISEIKAWQYYGLDWLYQESRSDSHNIPQAFEVPLPDIDNGDYPDQHCLFSFKWIPIFQQLIMTLVFVGTDTTDSKISFSINRLDTGNTIDSNSSDFARPCPPFCKTRGKFLLLP